MASCGRRAAALAPCDERHFSDAAVYAKRLQAEGMRYFGMAADVEKQIADHRKTCEAEKARRASEHEAFQARAKQEKEELARYVQGFLEDAPSSVSRSTYEETRRLVSFKTLDGVLSEDACTEACTANALCDTSRYDEGGKCVLQKALGA